MEITSMTILGKTGCSNCSRMYEYVKEINAEKGLNAAVKHETDIREILKLGVMSLPGVVINGKVVSYGKILNKAQLEDLVTANR